VTSVLAVIILGEVIALILAAIVGFVVAKATDKFGANRHIREILNFNFSGEDNEANDLLFVFPHRPRRDKHEILPPIAVEDALAINNILTLLRKIGWTGRSRIRNAADLEDRDRNRNIVALGGPKANTFTAAILEQTKEQEQNYTHYDPVVEFVSDKQKNPDHWQIVRGSLPYPSNSYKVHGPGEEIEDYALVIKLSNPEDYRDNPKEPRNKVLVIAGVRGIGTWAASDYLRKRIQKIHERKSGRHGFRKDGDFAAVIKGKQKKLDITYTKCHDFFDIS
jgi:hypothetical protein